jgi:hypothetical protein
MNRSLTLSIPSPCEQKWTSFTTAQGGGFCSACSKIVVDFTEMSDEQMIDYFQRSNGKTCGRFLPGQLKTFALRPPVKIQPGWMLLRAGAMSIVLLAVSKPSGAQNPTQKTTTELASSYTIPTDTTGLTFKGIVTSADDHSALPGVNVVLKGTPVGTSTDIDGRFTLPQKVKKGDVLVFSFIGLTTKEYRVDGKKDAGFEVPMQLCMDYDVMGEVQVDGLYNEKRPRGLWSRVKALF